ncbi:MAG: redoxin domain-containing protein [Myxococcota bacterium]
MNCTHGLAMRLRRLPRTPFSATLCATTLTAGLLAGLTMSAGCAPPPDTGDDTASAGTPTGADDGADAGGTDNAGSDDGGLDVSQLDRSADGGECGWPAGPYGTDVGDRLANSLSFNLKECDSTVIDFDTYLCPSEGNKAVLINIGAGWCGPCQEETLEFPELYEEFADEGLEIVQVMFQDWTAQNPTSSFCEDWRSGEWEGGAVDIDLPFPVLIDQTNEWTGVYLQDPQAATPINMLIDANGNIRWKSEGQKVGLDVLRTQINAVLNSPYEIP